MTGDSSASTGSATDGARALTGPARAANGSRWQGLVPAVEGAPGGKVTVNEAAGAFGPELAHTALRTVAKKIAGDAKSKHSDRHFIVVGDRSLVAAGVTARLVWDSLDGMHQRLAELTTATGRADSEIGQLVTSLKNVLDDVTAVHPPNGEEDASEGEDEVKAFGGEHDDAPAAAPTTPLSGGIGAAFDTLALLRTDHSLTSAEVDASPAQLVAYVAARLVETGAHVSIDGFTGASESQVLNRYKSVRDVHGQALRQLVEVDSLLAAAESLNDWHRTASLLYEDQLAEALAGQNDLPRLRDQVDSFRRQLLELTQAAGPVQAWASYAKTTLADIGDELNSLVSASEGAQSPLVTAARWERVAQLLEEEAAADDGAGDGGEREEAAADDGAGDGGEREEPAQVAPPDGSSAGPVVLFLSMDQVNADVVSRRSLLGTSGRLGFLASATGSWLSMDPGTGRVSGGGTVSSCWRMSYDLVSGEYVRSRLDLPKEGGLSRDWGRVLEGAAVALVFLLSLFLVVFITVNLVDAAFNSG